MSAETHYLDEIPTSISAKHKASHSTPAPGVDGLSSFLAVSVVVFDALKDASIAMPFPFAFMFASLAQKVLTAIQNAKDNKRAFQHLARNICELGSAILQQLVEKEVVDTELNKNVEVLLGTLGEILQFVQESSARSRFMRFLSSKSDIRTIKEYREQLRCALDMFGVQSLINIQLMIAKLIARQGNTERTEDTHVTSRDQSTRESTTGSFGPNAWLSGATINNIRGSHTEIRNFNNVSVVNSHNVCHTVTDGVPVHQTRTLTGSRNPLWPYSHGHFPSHASIHHEVPW
ncbi:hypothetical protein K435DRAFT_110041 [Dendrothele bispora CBS 962.96]|uniref:Uncharacterized protein n=1 Tax=Dendrothele bispora (strain CBS 962.96) TaxID=1314807 RepID=A0A4S8M1V6_DENBC|nr:hypothetical protein K435DRAFT_110041 [Dendrothele bispora CBS 962.96]